MENRIEVGCFLVTPKGLKKVTRVVTENTRFDIDGIGGSIAINEGGMDKLIYKANQFERFKYFFGINTYSKTTNNMNWKFWKKKPCMKKPKFYFTRFHRKTPHAGWQLGVLGFAIEYRKWPNHSHFTYFRCYNFAFIVYKNRSLGWTMPKLKNINI